MGVMGIFACGLGVFAGALAAWYGVEGLWYAATASPIPDRAGDFFGAGILTAIGIITVVYSVRWALTALRSLKQRSSS